MKYKVRAYDIDYSVEDEDVCAEFDNDPELETDSEEYYEAVHNKVKQILNDLPREMVLTVECDEEEDLEEEITDTITESSGWLIIGYSYDVLQKEAL